MRIILSTGRIEYVSELSSVNLLRTERLTLGLPDPAEAPRVVAYLLANRDHFAPFTPPAPKDLFAEPYWHERLQKNLDEFDRDKSLRLFLFAGGDLHSPVIGTCAFTNFVRGPFQACTLGYGLDRSEQGKGLMYEALTAAIGYVFDELRFHRVMANHLPSNERSARLLRRLGFVVEGYARDYLFINGAWRDHVLTALTNPSPIDPAA